MARLPGRRQDGIEDHRFPPPEAPVQDQVVIALIEEGVPPNLRSWYEVAEGLAMASRGRISARGEVIKSVRQRDE
ncbi:hypothetical protein HZA57_09735, partial [Candidatus Poribacteria bacterium]|nr:hypothetical protein [Candidatus Poribacteria bacterium]